METLMVEITNENALQALRELEVKNYIKIVDKQALVTPSLPGEPLSMAEFRNWISDAEKSDTIDINEAKAIWANQRKKLQQLAKLG